MRAAKVEEKVKLTLEQQLDRALAEEADALRNAQQANFDPQAGHRLYIASKAVQRLRDRIAKRDDDEQERHRAREQAQRDLLLADLRTPPDLQGLVEEHGGWDRVPQDAWRIFNERMVRWRAQITSGDHFVQLKKQRGKQTYAGVRE